MPKFRVSVRAELDLINIAEFTLERWGVEQMERYLRDLDRRFGLLANHPGAGRFIDDIAQGFRQFSQGCYVIFYRVSSDDEVEIVRVLHKSQLVDDLDLMH
ncbi:MAG: type II toxin-antitoxin system RelE/ParE family toxin [Myxococcota bacterium]